VKYRLCDRAHTEGPKYAHVLRMKLQCHGRTTRSFSLKIIAYIYESCCNVQFQFVCSHLITIFICTCLFARSLTCAHTHARTHTHTHTHTQCRSCSCSHSHIHSCCDTHSCSFPSFISLSLSLTNTNK
jgi:hypothetical protein